MRRNLFALLFLAAMSALTAPLFSAPMPTWKHKPQQPKAATVRGINDRLPETFYPTYIRSPKSMTTSGQWKMFVARVPFRTTKNNVTLRVHGSITQLQTNLPIPQSSCIMVFTPGSPAIDASDPNKIKFGTEYGGLDIGDANATWEIPIPTATASFIDIAFFDADQNIPNNTPATQVAAVVEYVYTPERPGDVPGVEFNHKDADQNKSTEIKYQFGWDSESTSAPPVNKHWSVLKLQQMTFGGGWDIKRDEFPQDDYPAPHWSRDPAAEDRPCPYLYSAKSEPGKNTMRISAAEWTIDDAGDDPIVAGTPVQISAAYKDKDGTAVMFVPVNAAVTATSVSIPAATPLVASSAFNVSTRYFNPLDLTLQLRFTTNNADPKFDDAGSTMNPVYVSLGFPGTFPSYTVQPFRTVVHVACAKDQQPNSENAFLKTWDIFKTLDVQGWNANSKNFSRPLYYYKPGTTFPQNPKEFSALLNAGTGRCGTWARFLWCASMLNEKELQGVGAEPKDPATKLLVVKKWAFSAAPSTPNQWKLDMKWNECRKYDMYPAPHPNNNYGEMTSEDTLKGQNSGKFAPSEKIFDDHALLRSGTDYYDPSYGKIYTGADQFQEDAIDGFVTNMVFDSVKNLLVATVVKKADNIKFIEDDNFGTPEKSEKCGCENEENKFGFPFGKPLSQTPDDEGYIIYELSDKMHVKVLAGEPIVMDEVMYCSKYAYDSGIGGTPRGYKEYREKAMAAQLEWLLKHPAQMKKHAESLLQQKKFFDEAWEAEQRKKAAPKK